MNKKIFIIASVIFVLILLLYGILILKVNNSDGEIIQNINGEIIQNIKINSKEGQECIRQLKEYLQNQNEDYEHIEILGIEKHEYDIIGDGYAMGTDKKPIVIGHNFFYYITIKNNNINYTYMYRPDADYKIQDVSYQFN